MTLIAQVSLGVADDVRAARFWGAALGYVRRAPRFEGDEWIVLEPPPGVPGCALAMDVVGSDPEEFPRIHLDLDAGERDLDDEVARLVSIGAQRVDWPYYPAELGREEKEFVVLADPDGNRFCVAGVRGGA